MPKMGKKGSIMFDIRRSIDLKKPLTGKQIVEAFRVIAEDLAPCFDKFFYKIGKFFESLKLGDGPADLISVTSIRNVDGKRSAVYSLPLKSKGHDARLTNGKSDRICDSDAYEKIGIRTCEGAIAYFDNEEEVIRLMDEAKLKLEQQLAKT